MQGRAGPIVVALAFCLAARAAQAVSAPSGAGLAAACAACHRIDGQDSGIPSLSGMAAAPIEEALRDYRSGARASLVMHGVAAALSPEESAAVARYLATPREGSP